MIFIEFKKMAEIAQEALNDLMKRKPSSMEELNAFLAEADKWDKGVKDVFGAYLPEDFNKLFLKYFNQGSIRFIIGDVGRISTEQKTKEAKEDLNVKMVSLKYFITICSVSDRLINPDLIALKGRESFKINEKRHFIVEKLGQTGTKEFYNIKDIFLGNGVKSDDEEVLDLIESLDGLGYVKKHMITYYRFHAAITTAGIEYLESLTDSIQPEKANANTNATREDINTLNKRIDEVITWLKKNDLGNELIYDEIQEMKETSEKLDKKNWQQLLKGKLIDLVSDKAKGLGIELARDIFNNVTEGWGLPKLQ